MSWREWQDKDAGFVRARYDSLAGLITFFEWLLWIPRGFRRDAAEALDLQPGQAVMEIGCGTGRNLPHIHAALGDIGRIYGVDLSEKMLSRAAALCRRHGWRNVELVSADATRFAPPEALDAILFGFSYNTMPNHKQALAQAWHQLKPGVLVVMDAKQPPGLFGRLVMPFSVWLMKKTLLGNPYIKPWDDVRKLDPRLEMTEYLGGSYYICRARKPVPVAKAALSAVAAICMTFASKSDLLADGLLDAIPFV
jgi:ubiquinone/menaquinone biosynthesis C-methylase UbiE